MKSINENIRINARIITSIGAAIKYRKPEPNAAIMIEIITFAIIEFLFRSIFI